VPASGERKGEEERKLVSDEPTRKGEEERKLVSDEPTRKGEEERKLVSDEPTREVRPTLGELEAENENRQRIDLIQEIARIDRWVSAGSDNGLFLNIRDKYAQIVCRLKDARISLRNNNLEDSQSHLSHTIQLYSESLHSASRRWRFSNLYGGPIWIYLVGFLIVISVFYILNWDHLLIEEDNAPLSGVDDAAIHAVTWGAVGGLLRGLWFLKDKVGDRRYRKSWKIYFISVPFIGGIFGALVYFVVVAGLLAFNPNGAFSTDEPSRQQATMDLLDAAKTLSNSTQILSQADSDEPTRIETGNGNATRGDIPSRSGVVTDISNATGEILNATDTLISDGDEPSAVIAQPLVIIPLAALAGFNWEWFVNLAKRIGETFSPSDKASFDRLLSEDITKLDH
jgi:hypothetical protein